MKPDFADTFEIRIGKTDLVGRRLTHAELKKFGGLFHGKRLTESRAIKLIRDRVTTKDGKKIDPASMTDDQITDVLAQMVLPKEGRGISDFTALVC